MVGACCGRGSFKNRLVDITTSCTRSPSAGRHLRLRRPGLIAAATKSMDAFDSGSEKVQQKGMIG
eukprot:scaffold66296_cov29-Phaeocystis_antarctica.AAC.1